MICKIIYKVINLIMKLIIDNREPLEIINYIEALNSEEKNKIIIEKKSLDIGDYIFYDENTNINKIIIERKSLSDLEASIKDGRYTEQSYRLNNCNLHNHNIIYLIEGNIQNYKQSGFKKTIYSSMFSLSYFKGFSVICSHNKIETGEIIFNFINKMIREKNKHGFYYNESNREDQEHQEHQEHRDDEVDQQHREELDYREKSKNYLNYVKNSKKSNITIDNIFELMLMQIPNISSVSAKAIASKYKNINNLIQSLQNSSEDFNNIRLNTGRKINKNMCESIKKYLLI